MVYFAATGRMANGCYAPLRRKNQMTLKVNYVTCPICEAQKNPAHVFCDACFGRLPSLLQSRLCGLNHRLRALALDEALEWFSAHPL